MLQRVWMELEQRPLYFWSVASAHTSTSTHEPSGGMLR